MIKVKKLCLVGGEEYEEIEIAAASAEDLDKMLEYGRVIVAIVDGKEIHFAPGFIVSYEPAAIEGTEQPQVVELPQRQNPKSSKIKPIRR